MMNGLKAEAGKVGIRSSEHFSLRAVPVLRFTFHERRFTRKEKSIGEWRRAIQWLLWSGISDHVEPAIEGGGGR
jgi:hypothetical protein